MSHILHNDARVVRSLLGATSLLDRESSAAGAEANWRAANAYMNSIGGGTDRIQRNIISERVLGLPREAEADRNSVSRVTGRPAPEPAFKPLKVSGSRRRCLAREEQR